MTENRSLSVWTLAGFALCLWSIMPFSLQAQMVPMDINPGERLRDLAQDYEAKGQWDQAFRVYFRMLGQDRQNAELKLKLQTCLRHIVQSERHRDTSFRDNVLSLSQGQVLALYAEVMSKLNIHYVDREKTQPSRLVRNGLDEFLNALDDEYFRKQFCPKASDAAINQFKKQIQEMIQNRTIENIQQAKDTVYEVAKVAKRDLDFTKINPVVLEFLCGACNTLDEYTTYLTPGQLLTELTIQAVTATVMDTTILKDGVAYTKITGFRDTTPAELDAAISGIKSLPGGMNVRVLILDLRGNIGGDFLAAVQVAERFVSSGVIVSTTGQNPEANKVFTSQSGATANSWNLVVLVDGETASAAEVLAGALRDQQRAYLIGSPTCGKGSLQRILPFTTAQDTSDETKPKFRGGAIRITLAKLFSPNGQALAAGITPHLLEPDRERQMIAALDYATSKVATRMQ